METGRDQLQCGTPIKDFLMVRLTVHHKHYIGFTYGIFQFLETGWVKELLAVTPPKNFRSRENSELDVDSRIH